MRLQTPFEVASDGLGQNALDRFGRAEFAMKPPNELRPAIGGQRRKQRTQEINSPRFVVRDHGQLASLGSRVRECGLGWRGVSRVIRYIQEQRGAAFSTRHFVNHMLCAGVSSLAIRVEFDKRYRWKILVFRSHRIWHLRQTRTFAFFTFSREECGFRFRPQHQLIFLCTR